MDAVKRHSQSIWPVSMPPLHAGTQEERITGEKSKKQHKHTRKEQTTSRKSTATALALAGNSTPALTHTHTPSQCCQYAGERIRSSTQQTHTPPAINHQWTRTRSNTPPPPPAQSHGQRDTATAPQPTHTEQAITQRATRENGSSPIHDAAPHSKRPHAVPYTHREKEAHRTIRVSFLLLVRTQQQRHAKASRE
ncbi:exo-alpha-sialidase [Trypanosoma cruzi]|nr:exo-alpha-sialidase [Trypanosoma cruzi]